MSFIFSVINAQASVGNSEISEHLHSRTPQTAVRQKFMHNGLCESTVSPIRFSFSRRRNISSRRILKTSVRDFYLDDLLNYWLTSIKIVAMSGDNQTRQRRKAKRKQKRGMTLFGMTEIFGNRKFLEEIKLKDFF